MGPRAIAEEARTLARFDQPNPMRALQPTEADGTACMAMTYAADITLETACREGRFETPAQVEALLPPLLDALERVRAAAFLHRDVEPDNVLVRDDGRPVPIDFASARQALSDKESRPLTSLVTPSYAPSSSTASTASTATASPRARGATSTRSPPRCSGW